MVDRKVVRNYASCLFGNVGSKEQHKKILEQMNLLYQILKDSDLAHFALHAPVVSKHDKMKAIVALGKKFKFEKILLQFLRVVVKNARFSLLYSIIKEYEELVEKSQGIKSVFVETAEKLNKKEINFLQEYLEKKLHITVRLDVTENKSLIGGVIIKYDSLLYDFSIAGAVNKFEKTLKKVVAV